MHTDIAKAFTVQSTSEKNFTDYTIKMTTYSKALTSDFTCHVECFFSDNCQFIVRTSTFHCDTGNFLLPSINSYRTSSTSISIFNSYVKSHFEVIDTFAEIIIHQEVLSDWSRKIRSD